MKNNECRMKSAATTILISTKNEQPEHAQRSESKWFGFFFITSYRLTSHQQNGQMKTTTKSDEEMQSDNQIEPVMEKRSEKQTNVIFWYSFFVFSNRILNEIHSGISDKLRGCLVCAFLSKCSSFYQFS